MDKESRFKKIIEILEKENAPVSGSKIANMLNITRQVVVQDVAVLKSRGYQIISTARGYILNKKEPPFKRVFAVKHSKEDIFKELSIIVNNGGEVIDVIVEHPLYSEIRGMLNIRTIEDAKTFLSKMETSKAVPLMSLSNGIHLHTVGALTNEQLDRIEKLLKEEGFLLY